MTTKINSYRDLKVWQQSIEMAEMIYGLTEHFPKQEMYGMTSQMRRASVSLASNIAEGWGRSRKEYAHFILIAYGSNCELETQSVIARRLGFLTEENAFALEQRLAGIGRMLRALNKSLKDEPKSLNPLAA